MPPRGLPRLALLVAAIWLAAWGCGEASMDASTSYFPLVPGARWLYEIRTQPDSPRDFELEVTARGMREVVGLGGKVFVMDEKNRGAALPFVREGTVAYRVEDGYVARITSLDSDAAGQLQIVGEDDPVRILPLEPHLGQSWSEFSTLFAGPGGDGGLPVEWSAEVVDLTRVQVPAGRFEKTVEVRSLYVETNNRGERSSVIYRDYYARGVGLVRSLVLDPDGDRSKTVEQVLVEYEIPTAH